MSEIDVIGVLPGTDRTSSVGMAWDDQWHDAAGAAAAGAVAA
jgi:hypothetical protein